MSALRVLALQAGRVRLAAPALLPQPASAACLRYLQTTAQAGRSAVPPAHVLASATASRPPYRTQTRALSGPPSDDGSWQPTPPAAAPPSGTAASADSGDETVAEAADQSPPLGKTPRWRSWITNRIGEMEDAIEEHASGMDTATATERPVHESPAASSAAAGSVDGPLPPPLPPYNPYAPPSPGASGQSLPNDEPLAHPFYGYSELGTVGRESDPQMFGDAMDSPARLHPKRVFYPGMLYSPQDLNPLSTEETDWGPSSAQRRTLARPVDEEVRAAIDFKDRAFLHSFLTEQGQLQPRRRTKLRAKTQKKVMRAIKLARSMALLSHTSRMPGFQQQKHPYAMRK